MSSPVTYFGGKGRLAPRIVQTLPPHEHYVEAFGGSLSVLLAKGRSRMETVNDLDQQLMTFWRVLRDRPADLAKACALTPHSRAEHQSSYQSASDELEQARRVWVQLTQGRGGIRTATGWRHYVDPAHSSTSMPEYLQGYIGRMYAAAERLSGVSLEHRGAIEFIERYGRSRDVLLYVDPPYLGTTRVSGGYLHEMRTEAEHRDLAAVLRDCHASVVLSGYDSELYTELYSGWHSTRIKTTTGQGGTRQNRTEVLWTNCEPLNCLPFEEAA